MDAGNPFDPESCNSLQLCRVAHVNVVERDALRLPSELPHATEALITGVDLVVDDLQSEVAHRRRRLAGTTVTPKP